MSCRNWSNPSHWKAGCQRRIRPGTRDNGPWSMVHERETAYISDIEVKKILFIMLYWIATWIIAIGPWHLFMHQHCVWSRNRSLCKSIFHDCIIYMLVYIFFRRGTFFFFFLNFGLHQIKLYIALPTHPKHGASTSWRKRPAFFGQIRSKITKVKKWKWKEMGDNDSHSFFFVFFLLLFSLQTDELKRSSSKKKRLRPLS